jgi:hypothetical protein
MWRRRVKMEHPHASPSSNVKIKIIQAPSDPHCSEGRGNPLKVRAMKIKLRITEVNGKVWKRDVVGPINRERLGK